MTKKLISSQPSSPRLNDKSIKWRTSLCVPSRMLDEIHLCMESEGKSLKRRSQWIESAVQSFISQTDVGPLAQEEFIGTQHNRTIPLSLAADMKPLLSTVLSSDGTAMDISAIIRTAITQRLILWRTRSDRRSA